MYCFTERGKSNTYPPHPLLLSSKMGLQMKRTIVFSIAAVWIPSLPQAQATFMTNSVIANEISSTHWIRKFVNYRISIPVDCCVLWRSMGWKVDVDISWSYSFWNNMTLKEMFLELRLSSLCRPLQCKRVGWF